MGKLAIDDYWFFLRIVLDYRFLDPWDHGEEVCHFIESNWGSPMMVLQPRGSMKTGGVTIPMLPWLLAKDPTHAGILTNVREEKASYFARQSANIIKSSNYQRCFPWVIPSDKWGEGGYFLDNPNKILEEQEGMEHLLYGGASGRVEPNIGSYGVGGNITSAHVKYIIHDDLINRETAKSPVERERAKSFFQESLNCIDPDGQMIVCGTRWRFDDLYGEIESGKLEGRTGPFVVFKRGAERVVLDDENNPVVEIFNPRRTYVDFRGNMNTVGFNLEELTSLKRSLGTQYYALYQNTPVSEEDREFNLDQIKTYIKFPDEIPLGGPARVGIEIESAAVAFWDTFLREMRENNKSFPVERLTAPRSGLGKHERIRAVVQPLLGKGLLNLREDIWSKDGSLGQEIKEFDKGGDDALDALSYCILKAPRFHPGRPAMPYIAVDLSFTAKTTSDHTAIVAGVWVYDDFYVLDCHKFKAQKTDLICRMIFKMQEKYSKLGVNLNLQAKISGRVIASPGNERKKKIKNSNVWGDNNYSLEDFSGENTNERNTTSR